MDRITKKTVWGIVVIIAAVMVILCALGVGGLPGVLAGASIWKIIVSIFLFMIFAEGVAEKDVFKSLLFLGILVAIWAKQFGFDRVPGTTLVLAFVLIAIGIKLLVPGLSKKNHFARFYRDGMQFDTYEDFQNNVNGHPVSEKEAIEGSGNGFYEESSNSAEVNFGGTVKYFNMDDFRVASVESNFGSIKAYFINAKMADTTASINAESNFGSIELFIPREWMTNIVKDTTCGAVNESGDVAWDGVHTVTINAETNFGAINIHHV